MDAKDCWRLFLETGAPEFYMMYKAKQSEGVHVPNGQSAGSASNGLQ